MLGLWAHAGPPRSCCAPHARLWCCRPQPPFFAVASVSRPPGLRRLGLDLDSPDGLAQAPCTWHGSVHALQACAWAGKLSASLPSWVTAPVACVETLQPSPLPAPSIHTGIVSSHRHAASGIAKPTAELSKVYTSWSLCLGQDHHPSCPGLGLSPPDPSSQPVSHVSIAELPA